MKDSPGILIIRPGALGDTVVTEPVVAALRSRHPDAHIEIAGRTDFLPLLVGPGLADACRSTDSAAFTSLFARGPVDLPERDIILAYLPDESGSIAARLRTVAGSAVVFDPRPPAAGVHIVDHLLTALDPLGVPPVRARPILPRRNEWSAAAVGLLSGETGGYVVIHPGSGGRCKLLPPDTWAALIDELRPRRVVLTCGPADDAVVADVLDRVGGPAPRVVQHEPAATLAGVLANADGYFGCDSGVTHLAAALGAPTVAVFTSTDPGTWAPRGPHVRVSSADGLNADALPPIGRGGGK